MGGKTSTTQQTVQIPPEVMERYRAVNTRAEQAATQPFQQYSTDPSAFVAPLTSTQQAAIQNVGAAQNIAQPYYQAGAGLTLSGAQGVGPLTQQQIGYYQNPFTQAVAGTTFDALRQQQQQEMQGATANAIRSGAFGGDRAGLVAANLARQQQLGTAQAMAPIFERGYAQALQTAQGQQGVAAQDLQRQLAAGQQIAGLGTGATQTALQAAQGLLGAGTAEQQTQQAGQSALYNQFLQERGYPFQVAQFLANIAMGTGALSGSTTTTQQPVPFFSDEREKTNVQPLGKGLYAYDYIDDVEAAERGERPMPPKRVGPMAQDIEERAPGLVGEVGGHKIVKGLSPESMGGAVLNLEPGEYRSGYAPGGLVSSDDIRAILDAQKAAFAPFAQAGLYGGSPQQGGAGKPGYVPGGLLPVPKLMTAGPAPRQPDSVASQVMATGRDFGLTPRSLYDMGEKGLGALRRSMQTGPSRAAPPPPVSPAAPPPAALPQVEIAQDYETERRRAYGGLVGYAEGGGVDKDDPMSAYGPQGPGIAIPTEQPDIKPLEPAKPPSPPNSVMSDILGLAKTAASIYSMSDERMKRGMEPVGELYNGLPVYKYRMGDGPTQIGLSAQEASGLHPGAAIEGPDGLLRLDYDRATRAYGGLVPRMGYAEGGGPEEVDLDRAAAAIRSRESSNRYGVIGPATRRKDGSEDRPYGAYQVMGANIGPWTEEALGRRLTPQQFLADREAQDAVFRHHFGKSANQYGNLEDAASVWFSGRPLNRALGSRDVLGTTVPSYVRDIRMAYAGEQPRAAASEAIQGAAGAPTGLAAARAPARGETAPAEERGLIASLLPTKFGTRTVAAPKGEAFGSLGEFLTSRQFIQPLFEGVGAMASSPSLSGWGAALQGLGAASRAYTGLEKEMAGTQTEAEQARSVAAQADIGRVQAQGASIKNFDGRLYILVRDASGRAKWVDFSLEYQPNKERYQFYVPAPGETIPEKPTGAAQPDDGIKRGTLDQKPSISTPTTTPAPTGAPTTTPAPVATPTRGTDPFVLSDDLKERAATEARNMTGETNASLAARQDVVAQQNKIAEQANAEKRLLVELGVLGSTPGGFVTQGALQPYKLKLARVANDIVGTLFSSDPSGRPAELFDSKDIARFDAWEKKISELSAIAARAGNQVAVESLTRLRSMYPTPEQSQSGFAKNAAEVLVQRQVEIERARFINQYHNLIKQQNPSRFSERFSPAILEEFERRYGDVFVQQRAALEKMLNASSGPTDPATRRRMTDENGKPISWFTFIQKNASRLDPEFVKQIERRFNAPGIMNYFQVGAP